jgi:light-harvesting protein B-800-850 alpha chain
MNNGRLWCVVNPTVGIPLFLGAVALTSLTVHNAVLSNTAWYKDFYAGNYKSTAALDTSAPAVAATSAPSDFVINVTPVTGATATGAAAFTVTVTPKTVAAAKAELTVATSTAK